MNNSMFMSNTKTEEKKYESPRITILFEQESTDEEELVA
jgi:hypothetical protein